MLAKQVLNYDFADPDSVRIDVGEMLRPARRISVSEFAQEEMVIEAPGGRVGNWSPDITPYMVRPMDMLKSREHEAVIFLGSARTGKTISLIDAWIAHTVVCDPGDFLAVQMTETLAKTYSKTRLARLQENSPALAEQIRSGTHDDNVLDKFYKSGMHLVLGWPSPAQFASRDFKYVAITDYDRIPQVIGRDGSPFATATKRTETYMSGGMALAESSPGFDVEDDDENAKLAPHELPPARGITALFNRGTREVFYFQCVSCKGWYIPDFPSAFWWPDSSDIEECANGAKFVCRHCGSFDDADTGRRDELNHAGRWCGEGQILNDDGVLEGKPRESNLASFRLPGGAAAFQSPTSMVRKYLQALGDYTKTGDEEPLRSFFGQDAGLPYRRKRKMRRRSADELRNRSEKYGLRMVPEQVRFLMAMIDVQKNKFAVNVVGHGENFQRWILDRFDITRSRRVVGEDEFDPVQPAVHLEDWNLLISEVVSRSYELSDGSKRRMKIKLVASDCQGYAKDDHSVTGNAYDFYRGVIVPEGFADRFALLRGEKRKGIPRIRETYPDSDRKDRKAKARGEIPVWQINVEVMKDTLNVDLGRQGGDRCIHLPDWLPDSVFEELVAEVKDPKDGWRPVTQSAKNETWDLLNYDRAMLIPLGVERPDFWKDPPPWARDWDHNSLVVGAPGTAPTPHPAAPRRGRRVRNRGITSV